MRKIEKNSLVLLISFFLITFLIFSCSEEENPKDKKIQADSTTTDKNLSSGVQKADETTKDAQKLGEIESGSNQEAVNLIQKALDLRGSSNKISSVNIKFKMQVGEEKLPMQIIANLPNKIRVEIDTGQKKLVLACDGNDCWGINPMTNKAEQMPKEAVEENKRQLNKQLSFLLNPLLLFRKENLKYEMAGKTKDDQTNATKVKLIDKRGENSPLFANGQILVFIDDNTGLDYKYQSTVKQDKKNVETNIYLKNNKKVKNFLIPHTLETFVNGEKQVTYEIEKIEINEPISNELFRMPKGD